MCQGGSTSCVCGQGNLQRVLGKKPMGGAVRGKPLERLRSLLLRAAWSLQGRDRAGRRWDFCPSPQKTCCRNYLSMQLDILQRRNMEGDVLKKTPLRPWPLQCALVLCRNLCGMKAPGQKPTQESCVKLATSVFTSGKVQLTEAKPLGGQGKFHRRTQEWLQQLRPKLPLA